MQHKNNYGNTDVSLFKLKD